jgi:GTP-binding protein Era
MRSGVVAILGRPNVGKSTFLNAMLSKKVSIVSPKAQTTRDDILGIYSDKECQLVFVDTPGLFDGSEALDKRMNKAAKSSLSGADAALYMIDCSEKDTSKDDEILKRLKFPCPLIILLNKIDLARAPEMEAFKKHYAETCPNARQIEISALRNFGLKDVRQALEALMPEGPLLFPEGTLTDKDKPFEAKEAIREKLLRYLKEEVPHQCAVKIDRYEEKPHGISIEATVFVEKKTQVAIVVGKGGAMIKKIQEGARRELERMWHTHVNLHLEVSHEANWRNRPDALSVLGYADE